MTELIDYYDGRLVFRRPDGSVILDTDHRMPARLGTLSVAGVTLEWPITPGEYLQFSGFERRWRVFADVKDITVDLGAYLSASLPSIVWAQARVRLVSVASGISNNDVGKRLWPENEWFSWSGGSMPIFVMNRTDSGIPAWLWRSISLEVAAGRWICRLRQGNSLRTTNYTTNSFYDTRNTRMEVEVDFEIGWGIFDL